MKVIFCTASAILTLIGVYSTCVAEQKANVPIISEGGVGPIIATTPFDISTIKTLLPALKVTSATSSTEGEEFPIIKVADSDGDLFVINPDDDRKKIFSVVVSSKRISYAGAAGIDAVYSNVFGNSIPDRCVVGQEEMSGTVVCQAPKSHHVSYVFNGVYNGPSGRMPSIETLKYWLVTDLVWKP